MHVQERTVGERIARGNTSDVWEWTPQTVVKVLLPDIPRHWAALEADITDKVHAAGLPVPAVDGVIEVDGRPGVVLERIEGETMWHRMKASADEVPRLIEVLVDIQANVQATSGIDGLPGLAARIHGKIGEAELVTDDDRRHAQALLTELPSGTSLCHGDMHPANIVMSPRGMVIVDWFDAAAGHGMADYTRSSLLLRPPETPTAEAAHLGGATGDFLERVHCSYLSALVGRGLVEPVLFATWEALLAVARMCEPVPTDDLVSIWGRWLTDGPDATARLLQRCVEYVAADVGPEASADQPQ